MDFSIENSQVSLGFQHPHAGYSGVRFDYTGKLCSVKFKGTEFCGSEHASGTSKPSLGFGFYNEFGFDKPVGFHEIEQGEWFHKIGVGLLHKSGNEYKHFIAYNHSPISFGCKPLKNAVAFEALAPMCNDYAYCLQKQYKLLDDGFCVKYRLTNTGKKPIATNEYQHNFLNLGGTSTLADYELILPEECSVQKVLEENDPEQIAYINHNKFTFKETIESPFFYSWKMSFPQNPTWKLINHKKGLAISETLNCESAKFNVWGAAHVISPELFVDLYIKPGESTKWSREYRFLDS